MVNEMIRKNMKNYKTSIHFGAKYDIWLNLINTLSSMQNCSRLQSHFLFLFFFFRENKVWFHLNFLHLGLCCLRVPVRHIFTRHDSFMTGVGRKLLYLFGLAESGSSRLSALMIDIPGDLVWDLPCMQQASYLEGGPLVWMLPLYLHVNQKSKYDRIWCLVRFTKVCVKFVKL